MPPVPDVTGFHDPRTSSVQYVVACPETGNCALIDPVLDFDEKSGSTATSQADTMLEHVARKGLTVQWILDTHPHADHFSAAGYLRERTKAPIAIGERIVEVQRLWKDIYNWPDLAADGSQWDRLFSAGDRFSIGNLEGTVLYSPGHTLASVSYVIEDAAFIHDTLFMPDSGSARTDFPGGSAASLWRSVQDILSLPDATRLFVGHDYQPDGREPRWEASVLNQRQTNIHLREAATEAEFVALREERDRTLPLPKLMLAALQVNLRGGRLPEPEDGDKRFLKVPLNAFPDAVWNTVDP